MIVKVCHALFFWVVESTCCIEGVLSPIFFFLLEHLKKKLVWMTNKPNSHEQH